MADLIKPPKPTMPSAEQPIAIDAISNVSARLRIGEQRQSELRKKILLLEQNMLVNHKRAMSEIKEIHAEINGLKKTIQAIEDKIITIIKEIRLTARKEDIAVMKRYIELWNPITFVTRDTVDKIIDEKLEKTKTGKETTPNL